MFRLSPKIALAIAFTFISGLQLPSEAEARATVEDRELVSRTRVGRTAYLYTYRLTLNNDGPSLNNVNVWALCDAPGTTMVDEIAEFGDIDADTVVQSTGTFSFRQDRRTPFDPDCLTYEIGFLTPLIISGQAVDDELSNALIIGTVIHPESGRPIVDSGRPIVDTFETTADAEGNFTLEMEAVMQEDFVTIEAMGVDEQTGGNLENDLGTVGALHDAGDDGSIIINPGNFGSDITHITTALAELAERANGGPIRTDGELAAAIAQVDGAELLIMAAAIKTFIDNPGVPLPPGVNNTQELISNPAVFEEYVVFLEDNFQDEFDTAIEETAENLTIGFDPAEVPGRLYTAFVDDLPLFGGAFVFDFDPNAGGTVILRNGSADINWSINADGELVVDVFNQPVNEVFLPCNVPGNPSGQCRALIFVDRFRIIRLSLGQTSDQVIVLLRRVTEFPDDPLPTETVEDVPGPDTVYLAFRSDGILPIDPVDIIDDQIATSYFHQDNGGIGLNDPEFGSDFLTFNADGTGATARRAFGFDWAIENGVLAIVFDNGDRNEFVVYSESGDVTDLIVIGELQSGINRVRPGEALGFDGVSEFSEDMLNDRHYRGLFAVFGEREIDVGIPFDIFDFLFLPGGGGCRQVGSTDPSFGISSRPLQWVSTPENYMDSQLTLPDGTVFQRRSWQAIGVVPGLLGDRYWVIENLDTEIGSGDPNYVSPDPTVTPGRINSYEFIDDLTGTVDPCGFSISASLSTLFDSNNGGVGNMFNVGVGNTAVSVTELDVNVEYVAGTPFTIEVYTVDDGYETTLTAPPGCLFTCTFNPAAWTLVSTGAATSAGPDQPSLVDIEDFTLDEGSLTGFWVTLSRDGSVVDEFRYTNGTNSFEAPEIAITAGVGVVGSVVAGEFFVPARIWNGTIYYTTLP